MARNYYSELHVHIVWHTKQSAPLLTPPIEAEVHKYVRGYLINTPGVFVHDINGPENHVHVVATVTPTILLSELIGKIKGASAHEINRKLGMGTNCKKAAA